MAQKVVTLYTDDLTGEESTEIDTYTILVNGAGVEIDLTPESHDRLMEALSPFLHAQGARRVRGTSTGAVRRTRGPATASPKGADSSAIRAWAKEQGYEVNDRGRVSATVREAYEKAH
ncbi:histone-like nucleoid-structuring protein Lsr2 [Actinacidiphila acididurans]|uniref:Lsr2 family protein n=1 Tax=Actinacidiphila acididurans TaxID=2784346 RepID=A0ABS2TLY5_9ACTN|nr:Lsr2 family protein [Actinacidiphila acididurans]MBM9504016.1 Lsr2 family protein [Actinacidiphila acididurans]